MFRAFPLLLASRRDAEHGEREGDPRPRFHGQLADGWVDYIRLDTAQNVYRTLNKLWTHQPVLLRGTPLAAGLVGRWSFQQLVSALLAACWWCCPAAQGGCQEGQAGNVPCHVAPMQARCIGGQHQLRVLCSNARRQRFFEYDDVKNVYGGWAGLGMIGGVGKAGGRVVCTGQAHTG